MRIWLVEQLPFENLKLCLLCPPILVMYDQLMYELYHSNQILMTCNMNLGLFIPFLSRQRTKKVIAFVSRIFNKIRLNYSQVDKEILTLTKFHLCLLVNSLAHFYWKFCYNFNYNFLGSIFWSNGLVVKALDSQSRGPMFKTRLAPR